MHIAINMNCGKKKWSKMYRLENVRIYEDLSEEDVLNIR